MKTGAVSVILVILTSVLGADPTYGFQGSKGERVPDCGPKCVLYLSKYFSCPVTLEQAYKLSGFVEGVDTSTNMLQLKEALEEIGLYCYAFKSDYQQLKLPHFKGCAFVAAIEEKEHFVVIAKGLETESWFWIDCSRRTVYNLDENFFSRRDKGKRAFIAVSKYPIMANQNIARSNPGKIEEPPTLRFDFSRSSNTDETKTTIIDVGNIPYGLTTKQIVHIILPKDELKGGRNVKLKRIGCGACSNTRLISYSIRPENCLRCEFSFNCIPARRPEIGKQSDSFKLLGLDNSELRSFEILHETVLSQRIEPNSVELNNLVPGEPCMLSIMKQDYFQTDDIVLDNDIIRVNGYEDHDRKLDIDLLVGHSLSNKKVSSDITILSSENSKIVIPLAATISDYFKAKPSILFLGAVESNNTVESSVLLSSARAFKIEAAKCGLENSIVDIKQINDHESRVYLKYQPNGNIRPGSVSSVLMVSTDISHEVIRIPVHTIHVATSIQPK
jgi:hypothetical protein